MKKIRLPQRIFTEERFIYGLTAKQCLYLTFGIGGIILTANTGLPLQFKTMLCGGSISSSFALATTTIDNQSIDRFLINLAKYPFINKNYGGIKNVTTSKKREGTKKFCELLSIR